MRGVYRMIREFQAPLKGSTWVLSMKAHVELHLDKEAIDTDHLDWGIKEIELARAVDNATENKSETLEGYAMLIARETLNVYPSFDVKVLVKREGYDWHSESEVALSGKRK